MRHNAVSLTKFDKLQAAILNVKLGSPNLPNTIIMQLINDLTRQDIHLRHNMIEAMLNVVQKGYYVLGSEVNNFENAFAKHTASAYCISVANGTDALEIALRALSIQEHDEVATVANAGFYSSAAIFAVQARPVYVEIDPISMTMSPLDLEDTLKKSRVKAVIVTHLYGQMADMPRLASICQAYQVALIEDCAQAHGAKMHGKGVGTWGALGCFSFYPTKNLGAIGDGGAILTQTDALAEKLRQLRQYGWGKKYQNVLLGGKNSRLDELQAAILNVKLPYLDAWNERRRQIARQYNRLLTNQEISLPLLGEADYVAHLYVIRVHHRQSLLQYLKQNQIGCDIHYPLPDYKQECVQTIYADVKLIETEKACASVLTLPCFPEMRDDEVSMIAELVNSWRVPCIR